VCSYDIQQQCNATPRTQLGELTVLRRSFGGILEREKGRGKGKERAMGKEQAVKDK